MLQKRIAQWALMTVAVPLAAAGARKVSQRIEARRGPSGVSRLLRRGADLVRPQKVRRRRFRW